MTDFFQRLEERSRKINSLLCVGLDPRHAIQPDMGAADSVSGMIEENKRIIQATSRYALAYKPNIAFYEALGAPGLQALEITLELIPDEIPVILDAKRGDIGATALAYERAVFGHLNADAVTLSPYMGRDSVEPFINHSKTAAFILCKTSNPGSGDLQLLSQNNGDPLYLRVADIAGSWGQNVGLVVAGNDSDALRAIRARHPEMWFLSPGIGAQGGSMLEAVEAGVNSRGTGIIPVVARGISQAEDPEAAAAALVAQLNEAVEKVLAGRKADRSGDELGRGDLLKDRVLGGLIDARCFQTGEFTLKSGERSPFYIDLRRVMSYPGLLKDVARAYARLIHQLRREGKDFDHIAGIPVAALPLATAVSMETGIPMIFPRMNAKSHGTGNTVEGSWASGDRVLLLDDLITKGTSKMEALKILKDAGLQVEHLAVLIERGEQGRQDMTGAGIDLRSFARLDEFLPLCVRKGLIQEDELESLIQYARS